MARRWLKARRALVCSILPVLRLLPPRMAARTVTAFGRIEHALLPSTRRRLDAPLRCWSEHFHDPWDLTSLGRELAGNEVRWQTRDLLLDGLDAQRLEPLFRVMGRHHLDNAIAEGRGVVLLGNHFGSHLMPAHWLLRQGYPLRLYMERPRRVSKFLAQQFATDGPLGQDKLFISRKANNTAESAGSILRAARVLKAGMILNLAGDVRWTGPHTADGVFLGRVHTFSATWVALAALTGAPVVPVFCRMLRDGSFQLDLLPPFLVESNAVAAGRAREYVQSCLDMIGDQVRLDPSNGNEYAIWFATEAPAAEAG